MSTNFLVGALMICFLIFITVRGELVDYAGILGIGPKAAV